MRPATVPRDCSRLAGVRQHHAFSDCPVALEGLSSITLVSGRSARGPSGEDQGSDAIADERRKEDDAAADVTEVRACAEAGVRPLDGHGPGSQPYQQHAEIRDNKRGGGREPERRRQGSYCQEEHPGRNRHSRDHSATRGQERPSLRNLMSENTANPLLVARWTAHQSIIGFGNGLGKPSPTGAVNVSLPRVSANRLFGRRRPDRRRGGFRKVNVL